MQAGAADELCALRIEAGRGGLGCGGVLPPRRPLLAWLASPGPVMQSAKP
jgi:hypothetical protein